MSRRRSVAAIVLGCLLFPLGCLLLGARAEPAGQKLGPGFGQRYLVLATNLTSTMQKELRQAATAGYRAIGGWGAPELTPSSVGAATVVLLEKVTAPPAVYDYLLLETTRGSTLEKEIKDAGARGYRLMPTVFMDRRIHLMEKAPGPPSRYEYVFISHEFEPDPATWDGLPVSLASVDATGATQGSKIVGASCSAIESRGVPNWRELVGVGDDILGPPRVRHTFIAEKTAHTQADANPEPPEASGPASYLLLNVSLDNDFVEPLRRTARDGYRLAFAAEQCGAVVLVMEDVAERRRAGDAARVADRPAAVQDASSGYDYLVVNGQEQLSAAAARGFHPHPSGVLHGLGVVMERGPGLAKADRYLLVEKPHSAKLQEQLIDAGQAGLDVVAASRTAHMVIVRKPIGRTVDPAGVSADDIQMARDARPRFYLQPMDGLRPHLISALRRQRLRLVLVTAPEYADLEASATITVQVPTREQVLEAFKNALRDVAIGIGVFVPTLFASGACYLVVPPPLNVAACPVGTEALFRAEGNLFEKLHRNEDPDAPGLFSRVDVSLTARDLRTGDVVLDHHVRREQLWFFPVRMLWTSNERTQQLVADAFATRLGAIASFTAAR